MSNETPSVYISVLNWNGYDKTAGCLESLQQLEYTHFKTIVVDNGSRDDSLARLRANFPEIDIIASPTNLGFAGGHRRTLERALQDQADLLWMLNNDAVAAPGALSALVDAYRQHGDGIYGSVTLAFHDPTLIAFGCGYSLNARGEHDKSVPYNYLSGKLYREVFGDKQQIVCLDVNGSSFMIPLSLARKHGFMDEAFFLYAEETDYCLRMHQLGIPSIMVGGSTILHQRSTYGEEQSPLRFVRAYYRKRNLLYLFETRGKRGRVSRKELKGAFKIWLRHLFMPPSKKRLSKDYYVYLAVRDAWLNRRGKTLDPQDFLET